MADYHLAKLAVITAVVVVVRYWPWIALFTTAGVTWWLNLATLALGLVLFLYLIRLTPWSRWCLAYWPPSGLISLFIIWRGVILTLIRGGVVWRGTRYALADLKRGHR